MAAPVADKIQLPDDSGNAGKKLRSQTRTVGANTVHEQMMIPISARSKVGMYKFSTPLLTMPVALQNGTSAAHFWFINPAGSGKIVAVRRFEFLFGIISNTTHTLLPRTVLQRFTSGGTPSGAQISACKRDSTDAAPVATLRTAVTGLTPVLDNIEWTAMPPSAVGTAGWTFLPSTVLEYEPRDEDGMTIIRPGEGLVMYQPDAGGATAENRRLIVNGAWEEFE